MTNPNHCPPELVLAGIIRQVDGKRELGAAALAEAILAHPGSRWGPVATAAAAENSGAAAWPGAWPGISDSLMRSLILAGIIRQVDGKHDLSPDTLAEAILKHPGSCWGSTAAAATPEAGYERIPDDGDPEKLPCDAQQINGEWWAPRYGCDSLAKVLEQAQPSPPAAWPEISDSLIRRLVGDIAAIASETTIAVCSGKHVNPIKEARACLLEVLGLAAKEGAG